VGCRAAPEDRSVDLQEQLQRPIIVGYDGSDGSKDALALAGVLSALTGAEVIALSVVTLAPTEAPWVELERMLLDEAEQLASEALAGLATVPRAKAIHACAPSPAREINKVAASEEAGMIVLGSTHRGALGRVFPGSVAERLLSGAPCPVAVAPRGYAENDDGLSTILVAYDGTEESEVALSGAELLALPARAALRIVSVANPETARVAVPGASGWAGVVTLKEGVEEECRRVTRRLDQRVEEIDNRLAAEGVVVRDTDPAVVLADASADADLLVMGSRGYGPMGSLLLGGVSLKLMRKAACPVIVMTRPHLEGGDS
jgi:nucleotide-binding universal stress UspA family protein